MSLAALDAIHKWVKYGENDVEENTGIAHACIHLHAGYL